MNNRAQKQYAKKPILNIDAEGKNYGKRRTSKYHMLIKFILYFLSLGPCPKEVVKIHTAMWSLYRAKYSFATGSRHHFNNCMDSSSSGKIISDTTFID